MSRTKGTEDVSDEGKDGIQDDEGRTHGHMTETVLVWLIIERGSIGNGYTTL
jgi:hypothetical protein